MRQGSTPATTTVIATRVPLVVQRLAVLAAEEMGLSVSRWLWQAAHDTAVRQLSGQRTYCADKSDREEGSTPPSERSE